MVILAACQTAQDKTQPPPGVKEKAVQPVQPVKKAVPSSQPKIIPQPKAPVSIAAVSSASDFAGVNYTEIELPQAIGFRVEFGQMGTLGLTLNEQPRPRKLYNIEKGRDILVSFPSVTKSQKLVIIVDGKRGKTLGVPAGQNPLFQVFVPKGAKLLTLSFLGTGDLDLDISE